MVRKRTSGPRFGVGDAVKITPVMRLRFAGMTGVVTEVRVSPYSQTLDKYVLKLETLAEHRMIWDIELVVGTEEL